MCRICQRRGDIDGSSEQFGASGRRVAVTLAKTIGWWAIAATRGTG